MNANMHVAFVQQFGMGGNGGGPKLLRSLLDNQSFSWTSICCQTGQPSRHTTSGGEEIWLPMRPATRLDNTRFSKFVQYYLEPAYTSRLRRRILETLKRIRPDAVHIIPHSPYDWRFAAEYCETTDTPMLLSVHDDIRYTFPKWAFRKFESRFAETWRNAKKVFVICDALGEEYCSRYGNREWSTLTDGSTARELRPTPIPGNRLHVYFCGLLHFAYLDNFASLLTALQSLATTYDVQLHLRGGQLFRNLNQFRHLCKILPFAQDIDGDFAHADLLYLPLPFGTEYSDFVQYSLSTKLITYLASGVPILYHGASASALGGLVQSSQSAFCQFDSSSINMKTTLTNARDPEKRNHVVENAQTLLRTQFDLDVQRRKLASAILGCGEPARTNSAVLLSK